jgi:hypothetical protein
MLRTTEYAANSPAGPLLGPATYVAWFAAASCRNDDAGLGVGACVVRGAGDGVAVGDGVVTVGCVAAVSTAVTRELQPAANTAMTTSE